MTHKERIPAEAVIDSQRTESSMQTFCKEEKDTVKEFTNMVLSGKKIQSGVALAQSTEIGFQWPFN